MIKKKSIPKKLKPNGAMTQIKQLHACIAKDQAELTKLYKKTVAESSKKVSTLKKSLVKAKKTHVIATKNKKKSPKNYTSSVSLLQSIKTDMATEQAMLAILKEENKKFIAQHKAANNVTKSLAKLIKPSVKAKKRKNIKNKIAGISTASIDQPSAITS